MDSAAKDRLQQLLAFASLLVIVVFFSLASPTFFTYSNITNILFSTVVIGTLALGTTFVIITAGIDLSIGTGMALCAVMSGVFIVNIGLPVPLGVLGAIAVRRPDRPGQRLQRRRPRSCRRSSPRWR